MIAASDLNGTLTTGAPILALANWADQQADGSPSRLFKYRMLLSYLSVKFGFQDTHVWADKYLRQALNLINSPTPEKLDQAMSYIVDQELWPKRKQAAVDFLRELHQGGAEIILVSAAYDPAVRHFGERIVSHKITGIGTPVLLEEGRLSLAGQLTVRERKMELLREYLGSRELDYALGDSAADLPMLESARTPIAVAPDRELRLIANQRGWKILE